MNLGKTMTLPASWESLSWAGAGLAFGELPFPCGNAGGATASANPNGTAGHAVLIPAPDQVDLASPAKALCPGRSTDPARRRGERATVFGNQPRLRFNPFWSWYHHKL